LQENWKNMQHCTTNSSWLGFLGSMAKEIALRWTRVMDDYVLFLKENEWMREMKDSELSYRELLLIVSN
jgi:hypothetical protein